MAWERIFRVWRVPVKSDSKSTRKSCRSPVAQISMMQFLKAKITNCSSQLHRATTTAWCEAGEENFQICHCLELVRSIENRKPKIENYQVATSISNSRTGTEAIGRRRAGHTSAESLLS